jgi:hypothetical protein
LSEAERARLSRSVMNRVLPRRRRGVSFPPWLTKVSTSPASPAFIACYARMAR